VFGIADDLGYCIDGFGHSDIFLSRNEFQAGGMPGGNEGETVPATALISTTLELMVSVGPGDLARSSTKL
jgi:hypothetical protein